MAEENTLNVEQHIDNLIETSLQKLNITGTKNENNEEKQTPADVDGFNTALHQYLEIEEEVKVLLTALKQRNQKKKELGLSLSSYLQDNKTILKELPKTDNTTQNQEEIASINLEGTPAKIVDILDEYIRPAVASDGGNIAFKSYNEDSKVVSVILQGACSGCPSSTVTLKNGIENMLKQLIPGKIGQVVAVNH